MSAVTPLAEARRRAGIATRAELVDGKGIVDYFAGDPISFPETRDLPFLFAVYAAEAPLRAWLERLHVTGFAHGATLRVDLKNASLAAIDASHEESVLEACIARDWIRLVAYAPREATSINMGPSAIYLSCWTFAPGPRLREWLEGGPLPSIVDEERQARLDGERAGRRWLMAEQEYERAVLDEAAESMLRALSDRVRDGETVSNSHIEAGDVACICEGALFAALRASARVWNDLSRGAFDLSVERLLQRKSMAICEPLKAPSRKRRKR